MAKPRYRTPSGPLTAPSPHWAWAIPVWAACAAVTCGVLILALTWDHTWTTGADPRWEFKALTPVGGRLLFVGTALMWCVTGFLIARATRCVGMVVTASILIPVAIAIGVGFWGFTLPTWSERGRLEAADGRTYVALEDHQLDGVMSSIATVRPASLFVETVEVLEHGDRFPGDAGFVLEPVGADLPEEAVLVRQRDGGVAVLRHELGWATGALFARSPDGQACNVDPFVMFDADDVGDEAMLDKWVSWMRRRRKAFGRPTLAALQSGRDHPSPWVRAAAARLIAAAEESQSDS